MDRAPANFTLERLGRTLVKKWFPSPSFRILFAPKESSALKEVGNVLYEKVGYSYDVLSGAYTILDLLVLVQDDKNMHEIDVLDLAYIVEEEEEDENISLHLGKREFENDQAEHEKSISHSSGNRSPFLYNLEGSRNNLPPFKNENSISNLNFPGVFNLHDHDEITQNSNSFIDFELQRNQGVSRISNPSNPFLQLKGKYLKLSL